MIPTIVTGLIVLAVCALAVRSLWKDRKSGKNCSTCSGDCAHCGIHHDEVS